MSRIVREKIESILNSADKGYWTREAILDALVMVCTPAPAGQVVEALREIEKWSVVGKMTEQGMREALTYINTLANKAIRQPVETVDHAEIVAQWDAEEHLALSARQKDKLVNALEFYAAHHHVLNTTAPNWAREAIEAIEAIRSKSVDDTGVIDHALPYLIGQVESCLKKLHIAMSSYQTDQWSKFDDLQKSVYALRTFITEEK